MAPLILPTLGLDSFQKRQAEMYVLICYGFLFDLLRGRKSSLLDSQIVSFLQIELALGTQSAISVGWKIREENVSAAAALKVE